ncbi:hypothetical protein ACFFRR_005917 [Megaselia abdita]
MSDKKGSSQSYPTAPNGEDAFYQREAPPPYESLYPSLGAHAQPQPQHPQQQYYQTMQSAQPQALYYSHQPQQYYQQPQQYQYEYQPQQQYYVTQQFNPQPQTLYGRLFYGASNWQKILGAIHYQTRFPPRQYIILLLL